MKDYFPSPSPYVVGNYGSPYSYPAPVEYVAPPRRYRVSKIISSRGIISNLFISEGQDHIRP